MEYNNQIKTLYYVGGFVIEYDGFVYLNIFPGSSEQKGQRSDYFSYAILIKNNLFTVILYTYSWQL